MSIPRKIPEVVKKEIGRIDKESEVILFGSRARGDYSIESDWDFLILLNSSITNELEKTVRNKLYEIELETGEIITSIIEEKTEWEKYGQTRIYRNIEEQGILVTTR